MTRSTLGKRDSLVLILLRMTVMQNWYKMRMAFMESISRESDSVQYIQMNQLFILSISSLPRDTLKAIQTSW